MAATEQKWDWAELREKHKKVQKVIALTDLIKPSDNNKRALLATAIWDDEAVRHASAENSAAYLDRIDEQESRTPFWMWCVLYFILGMLFMITVDTVSFGWEELLVYFQEIIGKQQ